jgi:AmmeMemoRadiSam system protein A
MMSKVILAGLLPHPPVVVPEVGGADAARVEKTRRAMEEFATQVSRAAPETIVLISPHGPVFSDTIAVTTMPTAEGSLKNFGAPQVRVRWDNDLALARSVLARAKTMGLPAIGLDESLAREYKARSLDHGTIVPLWFLHLAAVKCLVVPVAMGVLPPPSLYAFGRAIREAAAETGRRIAVIASGDLSHRLTPDAPAGFDPDGKVFDREITAALESGDIEALFRLDPQTARNAGECGLRPIRIMSGALDGCEIDAKLLSYEGPFGVGYAVALFRPGEPRRERELQGVIEEIHRGAARQRRAGEGPITALARKALETYVRTGDALEAPDPLPTELRGRAGAFVSLKKEGELRGCIGTIGPTRKNLAEEIIAMAIEAGTDDPRFHPVGADELDDLTYSVDVLGEPEDIPGPEHLDPRRYGVIVEKGRRRGLLLPNLDGVDTVKEQVDIACRKAGLTPGDPGIKYQRFEVTRHT